MELRAGSLILQLDGVDLRSIVWGDHEVLRRVYVAVRDRDWGTVPPVVRDVALKRRSDSFELSFECLHQSGSIDFRWKGSVAGRPDGSIDYQFHGRAYSSFFRNRIGLCVHHPLRECVGRKCTVETGDGRTESVFPFYVAPHQPFLDLRAITHELQPGVSVEVRFSGEVFEMEDHRNWTDGGFKIYGTPLSLPFPVQVREGDEVQQSVQIRLRQPAGSAVPTRTTRTELRLAGVSPVPLPRIGFGWARTLSPEETARLRQLQPAHLRVDYGATSADEDALKQAASTGIPLELAMHLGDSPEQALRALAERLGSIQLARVLVFHRDESSTTAHWVRLARSLVPAPAVMGGTNAYFAELNRRRPEDKSAGACFSVNPQVHAFDDLSLIENLEAQAHVVRSAKTFLDGGPVVVSPVTLKPRFNPAATSSTGASAAASSDPRLLTQFGAVWTLGSLKYLCEGGVASVTYYEVAGPGGLMDGAAIFPLYRVFASLAEFHGGTCVPVDSSHPLRVLAFLLQKGQRGRLLVANATTTEQTVTGLLQRTLAPLEILTIDDGKEVR